MIQIWLRFVSICIKRWKVSDASGNSLMLGMYQAITCANDDQGADSIQTWHLSSIGNPIVEIRRSYDRLISTKVFPILVRCCLYIEPGPRRPSQYKDLTSIAIPMLKIRRSHDRLIFNIGIPHLGKMVFTSRQGPGGHLNIKMSSYQYRDPMLKTILSLTWETLTWERWSLFWDRAQVF